MVGYKKTKAKLIIYDTKDVNNPYFEKDLEKA